MDHASVVRAALLSIQNLPPYEAEDTGWKYADDQDLFPKETLLRVIGQFSFTLVPEDGGYLLTASHYGLEVLTSPQESSRSIHVDGERHANSLLSEVSVALMSRAIDQVVRG